MKAYEVESVRQLYEICNSLNTMLTCIMRPLLREIRPNINLHIPIQVKDKTLKSNSFFLRR